MTTAFLSPVSTSVAVELSRALWRKQILPRGPINTVDKVTNQPVTLHFDDGYFADLVNSFKANAFDQVPLLFSNGANHVEDVEQFRGEIVDLEVTPEGLDAVFRVTERGTRVLQENPRLGVSVKVIEGYERQPDHTKFPRALKHIAGLLDPAAAGMSPWKEVALGSEDPSTTTDLSKEVYGMTVPNGGVTPPVPAGDVTPPAPPAPPAAAPAPAPVPAADVTATSAEEDQWAQEALAEAAEQAAELARNGGGGDRLEQLEAELSRLRFEREADRLVAEGTPPSLVELARERVNYLEVQLARTRYEHEAYSYIEHGVPPSLVEIARPILEMPAAPVVELSRNGETTRVDVGEIVRKMLTETQGLIGLHRQLGSTVGKDLAEARENDLLERWAKEADF